MTYQVRVIRDPVALAALEPAWTDLLRAAQTAPIFASYQWNSAWWQYFGSGRRLYILTATDPAGQLVGLAPLMIRRVGLVRHLEFIGTGLSDSGDFVLRADCAEPVLQALLTHLRHEHRDWDVLDLDEVPRDSVMARTLHPPGPTGLRLLRVARTDSPCITLPATWEEYTRSLQRKARQQIDGQARRFVEETGARFALVTTPDEAPAAVARFYQLHLARWADRSADLNPEHRDPAFARFLTTTCERCAAQGWLRLAELWVGETLIASWLGFLVNGRWSGYLTGFDPAWSQKRPGKVLHSFVVRAALAEHARELDLGRGAEPYKYELGAASCHTWRLVLAPPTPRPALGYLLTTLRIRGGVWLRRARTGAPAAPTPSPETPK